MPSNSPYLTCREMVELVTAAHEGQLNLGTRVKYELHLGACTDCRAYVTQLEGTIEASRALGRAARGDSPIDPVLLQKFKAWRDR